MDGGLASALDEAILSIQRGDPARAELGLRALLPAELSPGLRARVQALLAQALLLQDRPEEAAPLARQALAAARSLEDRAGVDQVRELHGRIYARMSEQARERELRRAELEAASQPLEALLAGATSPAERVMAMVRKVNALAELGSPDRALAQEAADAAMALRDAPREQVLALLAYARSEPGRKDLYERALAIADAADETALVGAITRAARAEGLAFEPFIFGS